MDNNLSERGECLMSSDRNVGSVNFDLGDIEKNLIKLANEKEIYTKAQMKGAKYFANKLAENTPVGEELDGKPLSDDVKYEDVLDMSLIGFSDKTYYRAHFVELGTETQQAQHFIERTMLEESQNAMDIVMQEIKKGLNL